MPICPKCNQEYDEGVTECADCGVPFEEPGREDPGHGEPEAQLEDGTGIAVFRAQDEAVLDLMARAITLYQIPYRLASDEPDSGQSGHFLLVPKEMGPRVVTIMETNVRMLIGDGEGKDRVYRLYKPGRENEIRDPELLNRPASALAALGEEVMDELIEIVVRGDRTARHRAAYVLSMMGEEGTAALIKLLKVAIEKEQEEVALSLIKVIRDEVESDSGWQEITEYLGGNMVVKILALQALSVMENPAAFPAVLPLLEDDHPEVRDEADNTLCTLTDEDMGFDASAPEPERMAAIQKWEAWWARKNRG